MIYRPKGARDLNDRSSNQPAPAIDPYAQVATMRRSRQWLHDFSYEDGPQGPPTSSHSFRRHERSRCAVPASVDFVCAARAELIARLLVNVEQSEGPANAGVVASRAQSSAPQDRRLLSRAATDHGDRPLSRKASCVRKLCQGLVDRAWARAAQFLDHRTGALLFCT